MNRFTEFGEIEFGPQDAAGALSLESIDTVDENGTTSPFRGAVFVELPREAAGGDVFDSIRAH